MQRNTYRTRSLRHLTRCIAAIAGLAFAGCASADPGIEVPVLRCDEGACDDAGSPPGPPPDGGRGSPEGLAAGQLLSDATREDLASCYDGQDNDGDGVFDCGAPGCASLASCCVGATSIGCCAALEAGPVMELGGCEGAIEGCSLSGLVGFGSPSPEATAGRLLPNGDATNDSGIVLTRALDPRRAIVVRGVLSTPVGDCPEGCYENVALGVIPAGTPGALSTLRPLAAVVASASRAEIALVLAGETAARLSLADTSVAETRVELTLLPTGVVVLGIFDVVTGATLGTLSGRIVPSAVSLQLAVYGHNMNRSSAALPASSARDVSVSSALCDAPSRWLGRTPLSIGTGSETLSAPSAPSFTYGGDQTFVAFAADGALYFARRDGEDIAAGVSLLATDQRFEVPGATLSDPDVHYDAAVPGGAPAGYTVYFANQLTKSIWRMRLALDGTPYASEPPTEWLKPATADALVDAIDGPSVLRPAAGTSGVTHVFARIQTTTGETRIVRLAHAVESEPVATPADWDTATVRTTQPDFGAFDRDEVASPAAYRQNGTIQVAFAGRSGARWALGLMATDDPVVALWRRAPAPTILSGDGSGFDALSVRDPAIVTRDTKIDLLYVGSDGAAQRIGYANREATNHLPLGP